MYEASPYSPHQKSCLRTAGHDRRHDPEPLLVLLAYQARVLLDIMRIIKFVMVMIEKTMMEERPMAVTINTIIAVWVHHMY